VALERQSSKPIENLRPQHLVDAVLWPEVRKEELVLIEEYKPTKTPVLRADGAARRIQVGNFAEDLVRPL